MTLPPIDALSPLELSLAAPATTDAISLAALPLVLPTPVAQTAVATPPASLGGAPAAPAGVGTLLGSLLLVLGLILLLARAVKRLQGGAAAGGSPLQLRGSLSLGGREKLVWIQAGETHLLLGVGNGPVSNLHVFDIPPDFDRPVTRTATPSSADFAHKLRQVLDRARQRAAKPAPVAPEAPAPAAAGTPVPATPAAAARPATAPARFRSAA